MKIPFVDLKAQYLTIKEEIDGAVQKVINDTAFISGKYAKEFEDAFAKELGVKHCIGVGNGTDALFISMKCLGIGSGDEVITAANSFIATSEAITQTGAQVRFVDVEHDTHNIDVNKAKEVITSKTKAIVPVHLYGQPADMGPLMELADRHNLFIIEDSAQAHLAEYNGKKTGGFGDAACFSFFPGKNLGAYGDAGAVVTNDDILATRMRMFANHGRIGKYDHDFEGINSRMDGIQGAILNVKLKYLPVWTEKRRNAASLYNALLKGVERLVLPVEKPYAKHVYHLYVIRTAKRDLLRKYLNDKGISAGVHYPIALPNLLAYRYLGHRPEDFPVSSGYEKEILSLPMYPEITAEMIEYISSAIKEFLGK